MDNGLVRTTLVRGERSLRQLVQCLSVAQWLLRTTRPAPTGCTVNYHLSQPVAALRVPPGDFEQSRKLCPSCIDYFIALKYYSERSIEVFFANLVQVRSSLHC